MILLTEDQINLLAERIAAKLKREEKKTYTLKEAAAALNLNERSVRRMIDDGRLRRLAGTAKPIIPATEIDKLLTHGHTR
jgi:excisionase family DNA binding protein